MDYKEKYEMAIEGIQEILGSGEDSIKMSRLQLRLQGIIPELAESEDERIRKALIKLVKKAGEGYENVIDGVSIENAIAWLEKQKVIDVLDEEEREFADNVDSYRKEIDAAYQTGYNEGVKATLEKQGESTEINPSEFDLRLNKLLKQFESMPKEEIAGILSFYLNVVQNNGTYKEEKQSEQKPTIETKLKIEKGKWYVCISQYCNCIEGRVYKATSDSRIMDDFGTEYDMHSDAYKYFRLWTIQDAKTGDVLACNEEILLFKSYSVQGRISLYCWYNGQTNNFHSKEVVDTLMTTRNKICPATKEQRYLLFQKMHETGYEWDAEKKELRKIEQKSATWSEEDDNCLSTIIAEFSKCAGKSVSKDEWMRCNDFLNSLKDRVLPRPKQEWSDEDEEMIDSIIGNIKYLYSIGSCDNATVDKKVNWLKSLTNRALPQPKQEWSEEDKSYLLDFTRWFEQKAKAYNINLPMRGYDICAFCKEIIERLRICENLVWENINETQRTNAIIMLKEGARRIYNQDSIDKCVDWLKSLRPRKQCCNDIPSREYILNVWELGNYWKELTNGVCSTEYGTELEYIQKHWKEGGYYDKISACPQKQWKPSEEQIGALWDSIKHNLHLHPVLKSLYQDLKKLREEFTFC